MLDGSGASSNWASSPRRTNETLVENQSHLIKQILLELVRITPHEEDEVLMPSYLSMISKCFVCLKETDLFFVHSKLCFDTNLLHANHS